MASRLKWGLGFGGPTVVLLVAALVGAILTDGPLHIASICVVLLVLAYMARQFYEWNGPGWRKFHQRAMMAYAGFWGMEVSRATQEGREPLPANAARTLWGFLQEGGNRMRAGRSRHELERGDAAAVLRTMISDAQRMAPRRFPIPTIADLEVHGGSRMAEVMEAHRDVAKEHLDDHEIDKAVRGLTKVQFGAQVVVFGTVSYFQGEREAVRYLVAALRGHAR